MRCRSQQPWRQELPATWPTCSCMGGGHVWSALGSGASGALCDYICRPPQGCPTHMQSADVLLLLAPWPYPCMHDDWGHECSGRLKTFAGGQGCCRQWWP